VPALRVAEGSVEVAATAPGYEPFKQSVSVKPNSRTIVKVVMTATPVAAVGHEDSPPKLPTVAEPTTTGPSDVPIHRDPEPTAQPESEWRTWTAVGLFAGGAGAIGAAIWWFHVDGRCQTLNGTTGLCHQAYDTKALGYVAAGVGAAALIGGGIVLLTGPSSQSSPSVALSASPGALWVTGRF
jgi:hypothetical protein